MPRVYLDTALAVGQALTLPDSAAHHLISVLRMQPGEEFTVFNGRGGEYLATLEPSGKRSAGARIGAFEDISRESPLHVTLAQCVSKGERMDYALQKAVELGVAVIVPLLSSRSVVRMDAERWDKKLEHWRGVMVSACEQSGRTRIPVLAPVAELESWVRSTAAAISPLALRLVLAPGARQGLREIAHRGEPVTLLVGPEGGLSANEIASAEEAGFACVRLGPRVLRTETAGAVCLANMQSLWGDLC